MTDEEKKPRSFTERATLIEWTREGNGPCWVGWLDDWNMTGSWSEAERWYDARHEIAIKLGVSPLDVIVKWRNADGTLTDSPPIKEEA